MLFSYVCDDCGLYLEHDKPMLAEHPKKCPECGTKYDHGFHQDWAGKGVNGLQKGNPTSVGAQIEKNEKKWGKELTQIKIEQELTARKNVKGKKELPGKKIEVSNELPWWRSGEVPGLPKLDKPLKLSKVKDTEKYIQTGETT